MHLLELKWQKCARACHSSALCHAKKFNFEIINRWTQRKQITINIETINHDTKQKSTPHRVNRLDLMAKRTKNGVLHPSHGWKTENAQNKNNKKRGRGKSKRRRKRKRTGRKEREKTTNKCPPAHCVVSIGLV